MKLNWMPFLALPLLASGLSVAATAPDMQVQARAKVAEFLDWERQVKPSGLYQADLGGALPNILSPELLCLLNAASKAREIATREAPDEKPPFVEGNPFLPNAWDHLLGSEILSSRAIAGSRDRSEVKVSFTFGEPGTPLYASSGTYRFVSTYLVQEGPQGARITDIDAGGSCDFCQSGSLRAALYETLTTYPAAGGELCKGLGK
ncbi:hypothetical protein JJJ22_12395 [Aeromonas caviae]|uniref:hypothetical protein n=1 Tax=Aeromonas caviae TaxID=648 RepID=UPI0019075755|nr:hypothetical protein [Aeromonas caviae]QQM75425.1 hypothetical protein JH254_18860 [Aeromonas caviae]QQV18040.1 hypothetical protein JJJ22_12395 [Aeromonas caviae]